MKKIDLEAKNLYLCYKESDKNVVFILLTVILWHAAFFLPSCFGICIIIVPLPLLMFSKKQRGLKSLFVSGLKLGFALMAVHFYWLLWLLITQSEATYGIAILLYSLVVIWFAITIAIWFLFTMKIAQMIKHSLFVLLFLYVSSIGYCKLIERYALYPLGIAEGYPFINPLIPLAHYKIVQKTQLFLAENWYCLPIVSTQQLSSIELLYLPLVGKKTGAARFFEALQSIKRAQKKHVTLKKRVLVATESFFPLAINKKNYVTALGNSLGSNTILLCGGYWRRGDENLQRIMMMNSGLITNCYDKVHLVFGCETLDLLRKNRILRKPFLQYKIPFCKGTQDRFSKPLRIATCSMIPIICSELFFLPLATFFNWGDTKSFFIFFLNDQWFDSVFCDWLYRLTCLKSYQIGRSILLIGARKILLFEVRT